MGNPSTPRDTQTIDPSLKILEETKALLRQVESMGGIGHWEVNLLTGENKWSDEFFHILGLDPKSSIASTELGLSTIHPEDLERASLHYQKSFESGDPYKVQKRIIRPNGEIRHVISEGVVDLNEDGKPIRLFGVFKDVTEERLKEEELKKTNLQIENILNATQDLIIIAEEDGPFLRVSKSSEKILGYSPEELIGKSFRNMIHPDDFQDTLKNRLEVLAGIPSSNFRNRYFKKDGTIIYLSWSATFDKSSNTVFGIARDITQLVKTKKKLKKDRQKLSIVLDSSPETIWAIDENFRLITANQKFLRTMKEIGDWDLHVGGNLIFNTPLPEKFIHEWKNWYERALAGETFSVERKVTMMERGGYMEVNFKPIYEKGKVVAVGCYALDITEKKLEEKRKNELLDRLSLAQKIGKLGYWEFNIQTEDIYWSDEVFAIWGIDKDQFNPNFELFIQTIHPEDRATFLEHHNSALAEKGPLDAVHRIQLSSGEIKFVHEKGAIEFDKNGVKHFRGTVQDITREKTIEKELLERNLFIESTLKNIPLGIAVNKISTGKATYLNPAFSEIYGWPPDVFSDVETFFEKIYPNKTFRDTITTQIIADIQSGNPERMIWKNIPIMTQSGKERIVSAKNIPLPDQDIMISTVIDETDRYWAEHSLKTSNERFHLATQAVSDAIWDWDLKKNVIFWGKGYHRLFGYPEEMEQVTEDIWQTMIHPDDLPSIRESTLITKNDKSSDRWYGEYRFKKFDGTYTLVKENTVILRNSDGEPYRMVGSLSDISEEKEKELELQKKTGLISSISYIIQSLLESEDWKELIDPTLKLMGETAGADRVYFFQNYADPFTGKLFTQQTHEWTNGLVSSELDNPDIQAIPLEDHPITYQGVLQGKPFMVVAEKAEENMRQLLEAQGIKSILIMPIFVNGSFYGFMGFDDCTTSKIWSEDEIGFLSSVTTNLSLAIERKQNLDKIREAFESRDSLLESIGDAFYAIDKDYKVTYWNVVVENLTGIKREKIIGKNIFEALYKISEKFKEGYEKAYEKNQAQYFEIFDSWIKAWLEVTIYPSNGGLSVIIRDITQRKDSEKQIREFNERLRLISQASHDSIWDWNIETGDHYWGEGFNTLFGEEISGTHDNYNRWRDNIHPEDRDRVISVYSNVLASPSENFFESEYRFIRKDGKLFHLLDRGTVLRDEKGKATRAVGAIQDITQRKSYEVSLKLLNGELAQTNSKLETSNKELEQFAYVASHDLQEPLRMISSFLGLIERKYANVLDEKGLQYIHFAVDGARRMKEIILDLLEFSRVGNLSGEKKLSHTPDLVKEVLILNGKLIDEKKAKIHVSTLPDIICHASTIIQLFQNLISNGLKYQAKDNIPEIWIEGEENESEWKFSVRDNGIGIDPEFRDKIFVIFQRLHLKEQFSGSGIGLAICKKIVEFHGGKIWVESSLGAGSNFCFTIKK
ncbi:PAS domain-containing protein [Algoriphagus sp.]|uniref:PAS domain-containing protein n=1 Tax=Algoriphagus sp. TaxID=1872435 RepID=UPI00391C8F05